MTGAAGAAGTALRWRRRAGTRIAGAGKATALMVIAPHISIEHLCVERVY